MEHSILRALAAEVHRRSCPGCGKSLRDADISAHFSGNERVQLSFRCRSCKFHGGGEIAVSSELAAEVRTTTQAMVPASSSQLPPLDPISADELLEVHELLAAWEGNLVGLLDNRKHRRA